MRAARASAFCLLLLGCSNAGDEISFPRSADIERIEAKLASHPCVGRLDNWERNYRFAMNEQVFWPASDHPDMDVVEFHYRRAGTITIAPARNLIPAGESRDWPDSSSIRSLDGSFVLSSGRLDIARCKPL